MENKKEKTQINTESAHWSISNVSGSILSMKESMENFLKELEETLDKDPNNKNIQSSIWSYKIAVSQFHNRFSRYYR